LPRKGADGAKEKLENLVVLSDYGKVLCLLLLNLLGCGFVALGSLGLINCRI